MSNLAPRSSLQHPFKCAIKYHVLPSLLIDHDENFVIYKKYVLS